MLYPSNLESKIGFDSIRAIIKEKCVSLQGSEIIDDIHFSTDFDTVVLSLTLVDEMITLLREQENSLPLGSLADLRPAFARTGVDGTFLDVKDVSDLRLNISTLRAVTLYIRHCDAERFPALLKMTEQVELFPEIEVRIDAILDKYGEVKDSASPELTDIRRAMVVTRSSVTKTLNAILRQAQADGIVDKETTPTLRQGRLVIPVSAMNKRRIAGIVHDESTTGKTVFVEPSEVVAVNNRLRELERDERREIVRILTEFTDFMRPNYEAVLESFSFLADIDALRAKALFSISINAIKPYLISDCEIDWYEARHPLLQISLERQGRKIEPLNIKLNSKQRILIISGPNAGGKSVCLKTVGLLQYMLQCGLPIPLHERSRAGLFSSLFIDIGDEQSIENDLSTYSSHLMNMKNFIRYSNNKTLLLIDEFGTGTEPQLGGAIAEAVLDRLNKNAVYGVITTHYTNLKHFASKTEEIVNGAMLYDRHRMQPLFSLSIGTAGSSFAIEIAKKIGLPEDVVSAAEQMIGTEQVDFDKHLQDVARDKRYWENKRRQIKDKEKRLQQLTEQYEARLETMKQKERETLNNARSQATEILANANAQIENTIRVIKETKADKERTKEERQNIDKMKSDLTKEIIHANIPKKTQRLLKVGDNVRLMGQTVIGKILEIQGKTAIVAFGNIKSTVALSKLEYISETQAKNTQKNFVVSSATEEIRNRQLTFKPEIDIRGMRVDEAISAVIYFVDDASMLGISPVRILHGTGTGALRQAVRDYLHQSSMVKSYRDEHIQFGGAGITVVEINS